MLGFETVEEMKYWLAAWPGRAGLGVVFGDTTETINQDGTTTISEVISNSLPPKDVKYEIWYNTTSLSYKWYAGAGIDVLGAYAESEASSTTFVVKDTSLMLTAQRMLDEAIIAWRAQQAGRDPADVTLDLSLATYPRLKNTRGIGQVFGAFTVYISLVFSFIMLVVRVVTEKERHVTGAMRSTGLLDSAYWLSYWSHAILTSITTAALVHIMGLAFGIEVRATAKAQKH